MKRSIISFFGAEDPPAPDAGDGTGTTTNTGSSGDAGSGGEGGSNTGGTDTAGADAAERLAELERRLSAADRARVAAETRVREFETANQSELEKATTKAAEHEATIETLNTALRQARIQNAFLSANQFTWHDPEAALQLADLSTLEIADDGKVTGLDAALKKLATAKPYLLKTVVDPTPSGGAGDGKGGVGKDKATETALRSKYRIPG